MTQDLLSSSMRGALSLADEDYLISLCSKGILNRAKKDLQSGPPPTAQAEEEGVRVHWEGADCLIRVPLMESQCSCPSSSMCRHRIAAILWLRQTLWEHLPQQPSQSLPQQEPMPEPMPEPEQLKAYPVQRLLRQLGEKQLAAMLARCEEGVLPTITEGAAIRVELPWFPATVHLMQPLEHSTCTCRSRELCVHKAQALLYWKLHHRFLDIDTLREQLQAQASPSDHMAQLLLCRAVQEMLCTQLSAGLGRMPDDVCDTVERMASLCHTQRLPNLERSLRRLEREYQAYYARSAQYRDTALLHAVAQSFGLAQALEAAAPVALRRLSGSFHDDYSDVGRLSLYLLAMRKTGGGKQGGSTLYYFWEQGHRRYYVYYQMGLSDRAVRDAARTPDSPWKLPCALSQLPHRRIELSHAKATQSGRLSSTQQCTAALLGAAQPWEVLPDEEVFTDFGQLLHLRSAPHQTQLERLALIRPRRCAVQQYDTIRQVFSICLFDEQQRCLWLEARYQDRTAHQIEWLEDIAKTLRADPEGQVVFFGELYREEDKLKLFPIEMFKDWGETP